MAEVRVIIESEVPISRKVKFMTYVLVLRVQFFAALRQKSQLISVEEKKACMLGAYLG